MRTVCLDFDGVLNMYDGWKGEENLFEPRPGAREFVDNLRAQGFSVIVHSTRNPTNIRKWLKQHGFDGVDEVTQVKPKAVAYVDDRGVRFDGNFEHALFDVLNLKTHWE